MDVAILIPFPDSVSVHDFLNIQVAYSSFLDLIDDITGSVDSTEKKLIRETHHVERVSKKSGTCGK